MTSKEDTLKITDNPNCQFRLYEWERIEALEKTVNLCFESVEDMNVHSQDEMELNIQSILKNIINLIQVLEQLNQSSASQYVIWESTNTLSKLWDQSWRSILPFVPVMKSRIHKFTDAGPGVGVTNHDVRFRIADIIILTNLDYYIRHHLANDDSSQNEVERIQSYVGDAICDGGPLKWEYKQPYEGFSNEQLNEISLDELESSELDRMKYNAFKVCDELRFHIEGAPASGGFMKAYTSQTNEYFYFNNHQHLKKYLAASENAKIALPGSHYFKMVQDFIEKHFDIGEKYLEYVRYACLDDS